MTDPGPPRGPSLSVTVRHFAVLREQRGCDSEQVEVPEGTTVGQLYLRLFPPGPAGVLPVMYAVDHCYVSRDQALRDGAEVAFIPPLGGG